MYVKIKNGTKSKQYTLTDNYAKPYIVITNDNKSSVLPLTTKTTSGLYMQVKLSGGTYRPLEYGGSTSETYYTTAENSAGLSSTTKLTRQSNYTPTVNTKVNTNTYSYRDATRPENHGSNSTLYKNSKKTQMFVRIFNVTRVSSKKENKDGYVSVHWSWWGDNLSYSYYTGQNKLSYSKVIANSGAWQQTAHSKYSASEVHTRESHYQSRVDYVTTTQTTTTVASTRESISAYSGVSSSSGSGWQ